MEIEDNEGCILLLLALLTFWVVVLCGIWWLAS